METRNSYGDVQIDLCKDHGIWLNKGELSRILDGYVESARTEGDEDSKTRQRGRFEGIFLGWWSLLLPK